MAVPEAVQDAAALTCSFSGICVVIDQFCPSVLYRRPTAFEHSNLHVKLFETGDKRPAKDQPPVGYQATPNRSKVLTFIITPWSPW
jgi:hypothetical protein